MLVTRGILFETIQAEIQQLAEYSAALYAKTPEEKESYLAYYLNYYKNQHPKVI